MEPSLSFARYPSLENAVVFVTGGASGIGEYMVRAFAEQGARIGFVDIATEPGRALAEELSGGGAKVHFEPCDLRDIDALRAAFANMKRALGRRRRARQQRGARRSSRLAGGHAGILGRAKRIATNLPSYVLRDPDRRPRHDRRRRGIDHQFRFEFMVASLRRTCARLHHRQGRRARDDAVLRARSRQAPRPRHQHDRPRLGDDGAAKNPLGHPGGASSATSRANACPSPIEPVYLARMALFLASDDSAMCTANNYMVEAGSI